MSSKNTPSSSNMVEEQRVQKFLELAAPIILDHRELDESTWESLRELARQTGLSQSDLTQVVDGLRKGGVIAGRGEATRPPPLPNDDDDVEWWNQLAPPPVAPPSARRWANVEDRQLVATFLDRARSVIAENRGIDARTYALLSDLAHSLGLSEKQFDEAIQSLGGKPSPPPPNPVAPPPVAPPVDTSAQRSDPHPPETYRQYLQLAIQHKKKSRGYLSLSAERKLIEEGVRKLGISSVYARHLIREEAAALDVPILSQRKDKPAESEDPQFEEFVARALPVLAQERGITPKAHMMLTAIARELNLDEQAIQQAVEMLQRGTASKTAAARELFERREAYTSDLRRSLNPLAGGVIAPPAHQQLLWRAEQLYGLPVNDARSAIHAVANKLNMSIVTLEQAAQYVSALIHDRLGDASRLQANDEWEILAQGEQWGLTAEDLKQLVQDCVEANRLRRARERQWMTIALVGSCAAVVVLLGAFYWFMFREQIARYLRKPGDEPQAGAAGTVGEAPTPTSTADTAPESEPSPTAWWDSDMEILAITVRRSMTDGEKVPLSKLDPANPSLRGTAYVELVPIALQAERARNQLQPLGELLARCLAREPDFDTLQRLAQTLLDATSDPLPATASDLRGLDRAFAALRIWIAAMEQVDPPPDRRLALAGRLEGGLGEPIRPGEAKGEIENQACGALMRRVLRSIVAASAKREPAVTMALLQGLRADLGRYLTTDEMRRQFADLLRDALPAAGAQWQVFAPILADVLDSRDPLLIAKLIEAYERSSNSELQSYLGGQLLASVGKTWRDAGSPDKIPSLVRSAMGLPTTPALTHEQRVNIFVARAKELLRSNSPPTDLDALVRETARLARVATLGWALARHDARRFDDTLAAESEASKSAEPDSADPGSVRDELGITYVQDSLISRWTEGLRRARQFNERMGFLDLLLGVTETVPEIRPDAAEELAKYLVSSRNSTEHENRLQRLAGFEKWNNLRIALAQELGDMGTHDAQVAQSLEKLYGKEWAIPTDETWPLRMRLELLTEALKLVETRTTGLPSRTPDGLGQLQSSLQKEWMTRASSVGAERPADTTATDVLRDTVLATAAQLRRRTGLPPEKAPLLDLVPHEVTAVDFLATHDLERAVRLERLWIGLLAMEVDLENGNDAASKMVNQDAVLRDGKLLEQLWSAQRLAVQLLLALSTKGAA